MSVCNGQGCYNQPTSLAGHGKNFNFLIFFHTVNVMGNIVVEFCLFIVVFNDFQMLQGHKGIGKVKLPCAFCLQVLIILSS